jgi:hypothetical protein
LTRARQYLAPLVHVQTFKQFPFEHRSTDVIVSASSTVDLPSIKGRRSDSPRYCTTNWTLHVSPPGCPSPGSRLTQNIFGSVTPPEENASRHAVFGNRSGSCLHLLLR